MDCNNVCGGTARINECGQCIEGNTGLTVSDENCYLKKTTCVGLIFVLCLNNRTVKRKGVMELVPAPRRKGTFKGPSRLCLSELMCCTLFSCFMEMASKRNSIGAQEVSERACPDGLSEDRFGFCCTTEQLDCALVCNGTAVVDSCGICVGGKSGMK